MTSLIFFIVLISILSVILLLVNFIFAPHEPYREKKTPFECGYHSFLAQNRTQFTISFFIFALLFLLFDLEIVMIYPYVVSSHFNEGYGFIIMIIFVIVLTLGFVFELGKNALKIQAKQDNILANVISKYYSFINTSLQSNTIYYNYITHYSVASLTNSNKCYNFINLNLLSHIDPIDWFISVFLSSGHISISKDLVANITDNCKYIFGAITTFALTTDIIVNVMTSTTHLDELIHEITRQLDQLNSFIDRFEDFQANHNFNVVHEQETIGVDTGADVSDAQAQEWSEMINIMNNLIHNRCHSIENILDRLFDIESSIEDVNYEFRYLSLLERYQTIVSKYRHF